MFSCWGSAVEADVRISDSTTCTPEKNKWLLPSHMKEIPYLSVSEMDFTSAKKKHELMVEKQVTPMATRSNPGIQITNTCPNPRRAENFFYNYFWLYSKSSLVPCHTF